MFDANTAWRVWKDRLLSLVSDAVPIMMGELRSRNHLYQPSQPVRRSVTLRLRDMFQGIVGKTNELLLHASTLYEEHPFLAVMLWLES